MTKLYGRREYPTVYTHFMLLWFTIHASSRPCIRSCKIYAQWHIFACSHSSTGEDVHAHPQAAGRLHFFACSFGLSGAVVALAHVTFVGASLRYLLKITCDYCYICFTLKL
jgi:hypothetical protein